LTTTSASPVAVTGGTGFIGSQLVHRLVREGARVRVLTRRPQPTLPSPLRATEVEIVGGEIHEASAVARLVDGAGTVFHLAGCAKPWSRDPDEFHRVNVLGTQAVCDACRSAGNPRLVHTSTNLVEIEGRTERLLTAYQHTKLAGEAVVQRFVAGGGDGVIVRPTRVYGPGLLTTANAVTRIAQLYRRGLFRARLADGDARGNYVHVDDLVTGMMAAAARGAPGDAYTLGGDDATFREFLDALATITRRSRVVVSLPPAIALTMAGLFRALTIFGVDPPITQEWVHLYLLDWPSSSDHAHSVLGYTPRSLRDGLASTVAWLEAGCPLWTTP
jgi:NAD+-dependent farnesol dehydrogenase